MSIKKNHIILLLKIIFIVTALYIVFQNTDTTQIKNYIKNADFFLFYLAFLSLMAAQIVSAFRKKYYFKTVDLNLHHDYCIGVYYTGMFFNLVLPGGVGGDGYIAYSINKLSKLRLLTAIRLLISARANGLLFLSLFAITFAYLAKAHLLIPYGGMLLFFAVIVLIVGYFISTRLILKENYKTALGASPYSLIVQITTSIALFFVAIGLGVDHTNAHEIFCYLFLFSLSSMLAVLPITIGGVGVRELGFLYGSDLLGLNSELGVAIALLYFVINLICSLNGLLFWHRLEKLYNKNKGVIDGST